MPTPTHADFALEFNKLLNTQGTATRSMHHGWLPTESEQAEINARATRLLELAQLMGQDNPGKYVNDRIAAWVKVNPEALTSDQVKTAIEAFEKPNQDTHMTTGVYVKIGEGDKAYHYVLLRDEMNHDGYARLVFSVPESVAEHFRQQGRRQIQREFANLMALESYR